MYQTSASIWPTFGPFFGRLTKRSRQTKPGTTNNQRHTTLIKRIRAHVRTKATEDTDLHARAIWMRKKSHLLVDIWRYNIAPHERRNALTFQEGAHVWWWSSRLGKYMKIFWKKIVRRLPITNISASPAGGKAATFTVSLICSLLQLTLKISWLRCHTKNENEK